MAVCRRLEDGGGSRFSVHVLFGVLVLLSAVVTTCLRNLLPHPHITMSGGDRYVVGAGSNKQHITEVDRGGVLLSACYQFYGRHCAV